MTDGVKIARIRLDHAGEVLSGQIETDPDVEVLDRNVHVATVSEGGKLTIELRLKTGRGYVSADKNFDEDLALGYIPIDSVHSPVRKVNFSVEAATRPDDRLRQAHIEVWTNGAVSPQDRSARPSCSRTTWPSSSTLKSCRIDRGRPSG
jgi:DNA-directed RNA polymerase subunit alpha